MRKALMIIAAAAIAAMVLGCKSSQEYSDVPSVQLKAAEFNQERYIWESFLFPTNRTSGRQ